MLIISNSFSQTEKITGNPQDDLNFLFNEGSVMVDIMDGIKTDPRQAELTYKLQQGIRANYEWFQDYIKTAKPGEPLDYHENLGITIDEYDEFLRLSDQIEVVSSGTEVLTVIKSSNEITFKGQNKTAAFNDLTIDLKNNIMSYKDYELEFGDVINVTDNNNGLRSKWKGYDWEFTNPKVSNDRDLLTLEEFTAITLTIGQLNKNGKIYLKIKEQKMVNGIKIIDNQVPVMF